MFYHEVGDYDGDYLSGRIVLIDRRTFCRTGHRDIELMVACDLEVSGGWSRDHRMTSCIILSFAHDTESY